MGSPRDRLGRRLPPGSADERRYGEPEQAACSLEDAVAKARELFDEGRFYEAHEFFEHLWKHPASAPEARGVWKGLAQVAVGYCHVQRGNARGAATLLERAAATLAAHLPGVQGVQLGAVRDAALAAARRIRDGAPLGQIQPPRLPPS